MKKYNFRFPVYCLSLAAALLAGGCAAPPLFNPSAKGDVSAVKALLDAGKNPNETKSGYSGLTALHQAAANSQVGTAKLLIERGANVNAKAALGTPLHYAALTGQAEMVKLLLDSGADPEPGTGTSQWSPLQLAEKKGHKMAAELIRAAISANLGLTPGGAQNANEYGPLVVALLKGYDGEGKTIAVAGFSYADGHASSDGDIVAARVTTELIKLKKLKVVERKEIEKVLGELKMQNTGIINQDSAKILGKMLGADILAVGIMTELPGRKLELNVRLVGVESGVAISAVSGQVERNWVEK
jgi:TolB-like protein